MFQDNNILLLIFSFLPALFYSLVISSNSPANSISKKSSVTYVSMGFLSIFFITTLHFLFPHFHDLMFVNPIDSVVVDNKLIEVYEPTLTSIVLLAFFQVAFFEEFCKWGAYRTGCYIRGKYNDYDEPYAIMFYSCMVSVGFACLENIHYVQNALFANNQSGANIDPVYLLFLRSVSAVVIHMSCGIISGFFIALGRKKNALMNSLFNFIGVISASIIHGIYDFNLMKPNSSKDNIKIFEGFEVHFSSLIIIAICLVLCYLLASILKKDTVKLQEK